MGNKIYFPKAGFWVLLGTFYFLTSSALALNLHSPSGALTFGALGDRTMVSYLHTVYSNVDFGATNSSHPNLIFGVLSASVSFHMSTVSDRTVRAFVVH